MKKVLIAYRTHSNNFKKLENKYIVTFPSKTSFSYEEVFEQIHEYHAISCGYNFLIDKKMLDRANNLQLIVNFASGCDNIDLHYAKRKGIVVANTFDAAVDSTADLALALLLTVSRRIAECDRLLRAKKEIKKSHFEGMPISGKTLGIYGMGRIGQALCRRAQACGMTVIYHNRFPLSIHDEITLNAKHVSFTDLLSKSDYISINASLSKETFRVFGEKELALMKPTAILINTARGKLVDEKALVKALGAGVIAGAGLDVFDKNDYPSSELCSMENVVLTPHIGANTRTTRNIMAQTVVNNIIGFFEKDRTIYIVDENGRSIQMMS